MSFQAYCQYVNCRILSNSSHVDKKILENLSDLDRICQTLFWCQTVNMWRYTLTDWHLQALLDPLFGRLGKWLRWNFSVASCCFSRRLARICCRRFSSRSASDFRLIANALEAGNYSIQIPLFKFPVLKRILKSITINVGRAWYHFNVLVCNTWTWYQKACKWRIPQNRLLCSVNGKRIKLNR